MPLFELMRGFLRVFWLAHGDGNGEHQAAFVVRVIGFNRCTVQSGS